MLGEERRLFCFFASACFGVDALGGLSVLSLCFDHPLWSFEAETLFLRVSKLLAD